MTKRVGVKWQLLSYIAVCILLFGCMPRLQKPEFALVNMEFLGGTLIEQNLKVKVRITNPNDRDVLVDGLHVDVLVGDSKMASGQIVNPVVITRQTDTLVDLQVKVPVSAVMRQWKSLQSQDGKLHYRLRGEAVVHDYGSVPFDHPGVLDLDMFGGHKRSTKAEAAASIPK